MYPVNRRLDDDQPKPWAAKIIGTDPAYSLARCFIGRAPSPDPAHHLFMLFGGIYDVSDPVFGRYFIEVTKDTVYRVTYAEVLGRVEIY